MRQRRQFYFLAGIVTAFVIGGLFLFATITFAQAPTDFGVQEVGSELQLGGGNIQVIIARIINIFLGLLGIIALGIVLYAGFLWMTAGGNEERITKARKLLINGVIGLVIIMSAFAITLFVLNKLREATMPGGGTPPDPNACFVDPTLPQCDDFWSGHDPEQWCTTRHFVVKSITPSTPQEDDETGMHNTVIRVVFSRALDTVLVNPDEVLNIEIDNNDISDQFDYSFAEIEEEDKYIVEARYNGENFCTDEGGAQIPCILAGSYSVAVQPENVFDKDGNPLEVGELADGCGTYEHTADFKTGDGAVIDSEAPVFSLLGVDDETGENISVPGGVTHQIGAQLSDNHGNAYVRMKLYKEDDAGNIFLIYDVDGPRPNYGSSEDYDYTFTYFFPDVMTRPDRYVAEFIGQDIDENIVSDILRFRVAGSRCFDDDPTNDDSSCGGGEGDACVQDSDCASWLKCAEDKCTRWPQIQYINKKTAPGGFIEIMNGAPGNWITIEGLSFGDEPGTFGFTYDSDRNGIIDDVDETLIAPLAECRGNDVWHDTWAIVEVPQINLAEGQTVQARVTVTPFEQPFLDYFDTSDNDFGRKPGGDGLFTVNDIIRPGMCSVTLHEPIEGFSVGWNIGPPEARIRAIGKAFGDTQENSVLKFNQFVSPVVRDGWSNEEIIARVPSGLASNAYGVYIATTEESNSVPFNVVNKDDLEKIPQIAYVDPASSTARSYITIFGSGFDGGGEVWISDSSEHLDLCLDEDIENNSDNGHYCAELNTTIFPAQCHYTWQDDKVIAQIPINARLGDQYLVLRNGYGLRTDGGDIINLYDGDPLPGICGLEPSSGPAPLPEGEYLDIYGINFSQNPTAYFWTYLSTPDSLEDWLSTDSSSQLFALSDLVENGNVVGQHIQTPIPVSAGDGYSMSSGPIKIRSESGGLSNGWTYNVEDCTAEDAIPPREGYRCCVDEGWKPSNISCLDEVVDGGYTWRFTTGLMPDLPYVIEECNNVDWNDSEVQVSYPSPSPWQNWPRGEQACLNATIGVRFSTGMDETSLNNDNVRVYKCSDSQEDENGNEIPTGCTVPVTNLDLDYLSGVLEIRRGSIDSKLDANTWYHVELSGNIQSQSVSSLITGEITSYPLRATNSCGGDTAYCFDFKTAGEDGLCTLIGAGLQPPKNITTLLGIVQDKRYPFNFDINEIFNKELIPDSLRPEYYYVWGRASLECTVLDTDSYDWQWGPVEEEPVHDGDPEATAEKNRDNEDPDLASFYNRRGVATAWKHTWPGFSEIYASIDELTGRRTGVQEDIDILSQIEGVGEGGTLTVNTAADKKIIDDSAGDYSLRNIISLDISFTLDDINTSTAGYTYISNGDYWNKKRYIISRRPQAVSDLVDYSVWINEITRSDSSVELRPSFRYTDQNGSGHTIELLDDGISFLGGDITHFNFRLERLSNSFLIYSSTGEDELVLRKTVEGIHNFYDDDNRSGEIILGGYNAGLDHLSAYVPYGTIDKFIITAPTGEELFQETITATSKLFINLGKPRAVEWWPDCRESCINAEIGVMFDRIMDKTTYRRGNALLYKCKSESCDEFDSTISMGIDESSSEQILKVYPGSGGNPMLESDTWYKFKVVGDDPSGIHALSGIVGGVEIRGEALETHEWKFKTKDSPEPCIIDTVSVEPDDFTAVHIGQKTRYNAVATGSLGKCSPYGQTLNPWSYGWAWDVQDPLVASVSHFMLGEQVPQYCTLGCLPRGSDIARGTYESRYLNERYPVCGNDYIDPGEDCDIGISGEVVGESCTIDCLRPGNETHAEEGVLPENQPADVCGNGIVEMNVGEECDPATIDEDGNQTLDGKYCTDTCLHIGSSQNFVSANINDPVCGSESGGAGSVTSGEDCDIDLAMSGCSSECLNLGTELSQKWCENYIGQDEDVVNACKNAVSVCGNGVVELGEECEVSIGGAGVDGATEEICMDRCLLYASDEVGRNAICNNPLLKQCDSEEEGCNNDCTLAGSSVLYSVSALCGDGDIGIGENALCEVELGGVDTQSALGQSPVQVVTALGLQEEVNPETQSQETEIIAQAKKGHDTDGNIKDINVEGAGQYALQCGYREFFESQQQTNEIGREKVPQELFLNEDIAFVGSSPVVIDVLHNDYGEDLNIVDVTVPHIISTDEQYGEVTIEVGSNLSGHKRGVRLIYERGKEIDNFRTSPVFFQYTVEDQFGERSQAWVFVVYQELPQSAGATIEDNAQLFNEIQFVEVGSEDIVFEEDVYVSVAGVHDVHNSYLGSTASYQLSDDQKSFTLSIRDDFEGVLWLSYNLTSYDSNTQISEYLGRKYVGIVVGTIPPQPEDIIHYETLDTYNDCPDNNDNHFGVARNSCCYDRPYRTDEYPVSDAGIPGSESPQVCRNTYIEATFNKKIDIGSIDGNSVNKNIFMVRGYEDSEYNCSAHGGTDVTEFMLAYLGGESVDDVPGFWNKLWQSVKSFFVRLFNLEVFAADSAVLSDVSKWCTTDISLDPQIRYEYNEDDSVRESIVSLYISGILDPDAYYTVLMKGGEGGITDVSGVGIKSPTGPERYDFWLFRTGSEICKIESISVDPEAQLFSTPSEEYQFHASVHSTAGGQMIVPTPAYKWAWSWHPGSDPLKPIPNMLFWIPVVDTPSTTDTILIGSTGVEGHLNGVAQAEVTEDIDQNNNQKGKVFSAGFDLRAMFCEHPWPEEETYNERGDITTDNYLYKDKRYNFSLSYCADAGNAATRDDDLPFFNNIISIEDKFSEINITIPNSGTCAIQGITGLNIDSGSSSDDKDKPLDFTLQSKIQQCTTDNDCDQLQYPVYNMFFGAEESECRGLSKYREFISVARNSVTCPLVYIPKGAGICIPNGVVLEKFNFGGNDISYCGDSKDLRVLDAKCKVDEICLYPSQEALLENNFCAGEENQTNTVETNDVVAEDTLRRLLMFNDKNEDVIGLHILKNDKKDGKRLSTEEWYADHFGSLGSMRSTELAGYETLTDGNNYYVNALNFVRYEGSDELFNNVYLFSINTNAQQDTRQVFEKLLNSLEFNINISDHGRCFMEGIGLPEINDRVDGEVSGVRDPNNWDFITDINCYTNFDCRDENGVALPDTNGYCSNAKTKFFRDWDRLKEIGRVQSLLDNYFNTNTFDPSFKGELLGGTYVPGYTNSRWPSWGMLSEYAGGVLPTEMTNDWRGCPEHDGQTCWNAIDSTFLCPTYAEVYEYEFFRPIRSYVFHGPLEFFTPNDNVVNEFVDASTFTTKRWCQPNTSYSPFGGVCGDSVINQETEECDPPGQGSITSAGWKINLASSLGECRYHNQNSDGDYSCSTNADCGRLVDTFRIDSKLIYTDAGSAFSLIGGQFARNSVCAYLDKPILDAGVGGESNIFYGFGCANDIQCLDVGTYASKAKDGLGGEVSLPWNDPFLQSINVPIDGGIVIGGQEIIFSNFLINSVADIRCKNLSLAENVETEDVQCVGASEVQEFGECGENSYAVARCDASCKLIYGRCRLGQLCGNGSIEGNEACDDGNLNGTYGHCNTSCNGLYSQYCGNYNSLIYDPSNRDTMLDHDSAGNKLEFCEFTKDIPQGDKKVAMDVFYHQCQSEDVVVNPDTTSIMNSINKLSSDISEGMLRFGSDFLAELNPIFSGQGCQVTAGTPPRKLSDRDCDGIADISDNCSKHKNIDQADSDSDGVGDVCDNCASVSNSEQIDSDEDSLGNVCDNCATTPNVSQADYNDDGVGNACDRNLLFVLQSLSNIGNFQAPNDFLGEQMCNSHVGYCSNDTNYICNVDEDCIINQSPISVQGLEDIRAIMAQAADDFLEGLITPEEFQDIIENIDILDEGDLAVTQGICITPITPYNINKEYSCSWDCQSYGGYCGDEIIQRNQGETCDDGNDIDNDPCTNICQINEAPELCGNGIVNEGETCDDGNRTDEDGCSSACIIEEAPPTCGNGEIDEEVKEVCDLGEQNGVRCVPGYGESCTYCARDCRSILTVDANVFCGNGRIDYDWGFPIEKCDIKIGDATKIVVPIAVSDRSWSCADENPVSDENMSSNTNFGALRCVDCQAIDNSNCIQCGTQEDGTISKFSILNAVSGWEELVAEDWPNEGVVAKLVNKQNESIISSQIVSLPLTHGPFTNTFEETNINTHPLCSEYYGIKFENITSAEMGYDLGEPAGLSAYIYDYPVNRQSFEVNNEYVISPSVPIGNFRIVIKWPKSATDKGGDFVLNAIKGHRNGLVTDYNTVNSLVGTCNRVFDYQTRCEDYNGVYMHPQQHSDKTYIHAMTIDTYNVFGDSYAVYATNLNVNTSPIYNFAANSENYGLDGDKDIVVEVYGYHEGQKGYSIYEPIKTFSIKGASGTFSYSAANFWHIFNLVKNANGEYEIREVDHLDNITLEPDGNKLPNGAIVTRADGGVRSEDGVFSPGITENIPAPEYGDLVIPEGYMSAFEVPMTEQELSRIFIPNNYPPTSIREGDMMTVYSNDYWKFKDQTSSEHPLSGQMNLDPVIVKDGMALSPNQDICANSNPSACYQSLSNSNKLIRHFFVSDGAGGAIPGFGQMIDFIRMDAGFEYRYGIVESTDRSFNDVFNGSPGGRTYIGFGDSSETGRLHLYRLNNCNTPNNTSQCYLLKVIMDEENNIYFEGINTTMQEFY